MKLIQAKAKDPLYSNEEGDLIITVFSAIKDSLTNTLDFIQKLIGFYPKNSDYIRISSAEKEQLISLQSELE